MKQKTLLIMKFIRLLFLLFPFLLFSCQDNVEEITDESSNAEGILKSASTTPFHLLGFGVDITKGYLNTTGVKSQIVDVNSLDVAYPSEIIELPVYSSEVKEYAGINTYDLSVKLNTKVEAGATYKILSAGMSSELTAGLTISNKYSYASLYKLRILKEYRFLSGADNAKQYLMAGFKSDLNTLSSSTIIERYGTHVYTDISTGGMLEAKYRSIINGTKTEATIKSGANFSLSKIVTASASSQIDYSLAIKNTSASIGFKSYGGLGEFSGSFIAGNEPDLTSSFNTYMASVTEETSVVVDVADGSLVPIYEFVTDPVKKASLKSAFDQYIASHSYKMTESGTILGSYNLNSTNDKIVTLDFNGDGFTDQLIYRPGSKLAYLYKSLGDGGFSPVLTSSSGIAGYTLSSTEDRIVTLDYNGDGKDDLFCYHPGPKIAQLLKSNGDGSFTVVVNNGSNGFPGYAFSSPDDKAISFDYNGDGYDDLVCYHPGSGIIKILKSNGDATFSIVLNNTSGFTYGYALSSTADRIISLDYNGDNYDDLVFYHPGTKVIKIFKSNGNATFSKVYENTNGIANYLLSSEDDRIVSFDYNGDKKDDLLCYHPGNGIASILKSSGDGSFLNLYSTTTGFADWDLEDSDDRIVTGDFNKDGVGDLWFYRPGSNLAQTVHSDGTLNFVIDYTN